MGPDAARAALPSETRMDTKSLEGIRNRIRGEHHRIAEQLVQVESLAERVGADDAESVLALRRGLQGLGKTLLEHLHYEEYELPTLAAGEAARERVVETMRQEHRAQRELLDRVIRDLDETAVGQKLVVGVRELARAIRDDMEHEERELLSRI